ncbi:MAG: hypothetical protein H8D56_21440 [Planctomycetes bacterium]|nr:hypothetical protein [Planctomycetota bacterium]MBL7145268.1 hypothetical protein [Phycisphaerae bacterium]
MKVSKKNILKIVIVLVIAFVVFNVFNYLSGFVYVLWDINKGNQRLTRLICETDYQALLKACRELSRRVTTGDLEPNQYRVRLDPHPEASSFPQEILDLKPTFVRLYKDRKVRIELHGGFLNYGVTAYPEDYQYDPNLHYNEKQLIPGLWYYDDDYRDKNPKHQKRIDALIQKGKMRQIEENVPSVSDGNNDP